MDRVGLEDTTPAGKVLLIAGVVGLVAAGMSLWSLGGAAAQLAAAGLWAVTMGMVLVLRRGGIVDQDDTAKQWEQYQQQLLKRGGGSQAPVA